VMPQAKQTATVDSIARLPMVESLLSSLGQRTSPDAKLGVEPVSLSSVKAGTQGSDPALLTQNGLQQSVTQAVSKGSQSLNPLYQGAVNARIEQAAWMAQIANHTKMAIKDDFRSVEIRLTPAHLGTIEILVSQDDEQTQLAFFTKHAQVREALEGQMPRLQKLFEEGGLKLGDAWVSDQSLAEHREHQTGAERDQDALTPPGFALDQRDAQLVGSMTAQKVDSSAMLDVWA
jgi:flagellar hook-length control protein FliK